MVHSWKLAHLYTCTAKVIFVGDRQIVSDVSHNHAAGRNSSDVQAVIIRNKDMKFIPRDLYKFFPNLRSIDMFNSDVAEATREDFKNLSMLTEINLRGNNIRTLQSDVFVENLELQSLNFISNPMRHIDHKVFDPLLKLTSLHFEFAPCLSQGFANNRANVELLIFRLFISCPPTFEMTEARILNGTELRTKTDKMILSRVTPLAIDMREINRKIADIEKRLDQCEFDNKMLKAWSED